MAVLSVQLGSGSSVYAAPFADRPQRFLDLLSEAEQAAGVRFESVVLSGWSAGYGSIREILKHSENLPRVSAVLLIDGLHASYRSGAPGPLESELVTQSLEPFVEFGRLAADGHKTMHVLHTEIFPGTFASTTETADYLLGQLDLRRQAVLRWGPLGTQQLSEARRGHFLLRGYAGNSAPDHVDLLHAMERYWREILRTAKLLDDRAGPWRPLFDGRSLAGWEGREDVFRVEGGAIVAGSLAAPIPRNEFLCTREQYGDFELRLEAKLLGDQARNAGIQFRSRRIDNHHEVSGYQCDMVDGDPRAWGWLYDESRRRRYLAPATPEELSALAEPLRRVVRQEDWNELVIRCQGPRVQLWVNGFPTVDYRELDDEIPRRGIIGLQIHSGPPSRAHYRHLRIRTLAE
jgi:hypothetical protein